MGLFDKLNQRASLMGRMMVAVGAIDRIPNSYAADTQLRQAASRCMGCAQPGDCATWLDGHAEGAEKAPDYCPNQSLFDEWKAER
jgi:hypothetical protein